MLCQSKDSVLAASALRGIDTPIDISSYALTRVLPVTLQRVLPGIDAREAELALVPRPGLDSHGE